MPLNERRETGEVHCDEREESDYDLSLFRSNDVSIGIDASRVGNEARFVNDYRGVPAQERANAAFVEDRVGQLRIRIESTRMIKKGAAVHGDLISDDVDYVTGEEILVSYGKTWWKARTGT
ncbi:unnamed protein product [Mycena citricolor]|uniref:SET domain-containing protein n=1 Tax=Mycena citricolor TaxID=2018698 RepID=A0AAD2GZ79_9AGAR|nr:unnamed protein product [Mycena citricolor]